MNSIVQSVRQQMTPEQLASYERMGKYMYEQMDYLNPKKIEADPFDKKTPEEIVEYADKGLRSGLLPQDLSHRELYLIIATFGKKWYERYGFEPDSLPPIPTPDQVKAPKSQKQDIKRYVKKMLKKHI